MIALLLWSACWPDVRGPRYAPWDSAAAAREPKVVHEPEGGGVTRTTLDATDGLEWVYLDIDARDPLTELDGDESGWDLAFSRQRIMLDGGSSGDGGVEVAIVQAPRLEDVTAAPTEGYVTDQADDDDENSEPEFAFDAWFDYNPDNHVLTPHELVFVVRSTEGAHLALEILSYYDDAGSSGVFSFRWKLL